MLSRVLVTGAGGFVGTRLVARLAARGTHVTAVSRNPRPTSRDGLVRWVQGDVTEPATYRAALREVEGVVHLAARLTARTVSEYEHANVLGTARLIETCVEECPGLRRVIVVSTVAAMGPSRDGRLLTEVDPCRPITAYGASKLSAEEAASHLTEFTNLAWDVVRKYGGQTGRITGTKFSAYFGVPIALEDAPTMAVNTAIELRNGLEDLNRRKNLPVQLGMSAGIDTGMVIAGVVATGGSKGYSVTGPAVTNASELAQRAAEGRIIVGQMTFRQTRGAFHYKAIRPISVARKGDAKRAFELLSTHEELRRSTVQHQRIVESTMVGRDHELAQLRDHVKDLSQGSGSIVSVVGEAGIGKSRLVAEFMTSTDRLPVHPTISMTTP